MEIRNWNIEYRRPKLTPRSGVKRSSIPHSNFHIPHSKKGMSLVEVLVAVSIITIAILAIVGIYSVFLKSSFDNTSSLQAAYLSEEGIEALKTMRDAGWSANIAPLTASTTYRLTFNTALSRWQATTSTTLLDGVFDRTFVLGNAYRDANENLATSGTLDPSTKLLTVQVSWKNRNATSTKKMQTYINNLFSN